MVQANYPAAQVPVGTVPVASPSTNSANNVNQAVTGLMCLQCYPAVWLFAELQGDSKCYAEVLTLRLAPRRKAKVSLQVSSLAQHNCICNQFRAEC